MTDDYLRINQANWDARATVHAASGYGRDRLLSAPDAISQVVAFDLPRLGRLDGLDVLHLQCHIGTDTLSLARLGARSVIGVDLSGESLRHARDLAVAGGASIDYVQSDVYSAPDTLDGRTFDLVYTGVGALCWLPDIARWGRTVAALLRPGGRLFIRDGHPIYNSVTSVLVGQVDQTALENAALLTPAGSRTPALEFPYFQQDSGLVWHEEATYGSDLPVSSPECHEWNHGLGQIVTAVLDAGLTLTSLDEHDSAPWSNLGDLTVLDEETGEYRLVDRPDRLPATFTLTATKPTLRS